VETFFAKDGTPQRAFLQIAKLPLSRTGLLRSCGAGCAADLFSKEAYSGAPAAENVCGLSRPFGIETSVNPGHSSHGRGVVALPLLSVLALPHHRWLFAFGAARDVDHRGARFVTRNPRIFMTAGGAGCPMA